MGGSDNTGLGLTFETVAHAIGYLTDAEYIDRVSLTLRSLADETPGFKIQRSKNGWMANFNNSYTGASNNIKGMMPTGLSTAGALFVKTYVSKTLPSEFAEINRLVSKIWNSINFDSLLCDKDGTYNPNGEYIPMVTTDL